MWLKFLSKGYDWSFYQDVIAEVSTKTLLLLFFCKWKEFNLQFKRSTFRNINHKINFLSIRKIRFSCLFRILIPIDYRVCRTGYDFMCWNHPAIMLQKCGLYSSIRVLKYWCNILRYPSESYNLWQCIRMKIVATVCMQMSCIKSSLVL